MILSRPHRNRTPVTLYLAASGIGHKISGIGHLDHIRQHHQNVCGAVRTVADTIGHRYMGANALRRPRRLWKSIDMNAPNITTHRH